ncbi:phage antirepressor KilAC domain-containing protein [uncultured Corynebacterium sp.]|uniref:phage antirepressor KilAC domain-containing protein n=1 Tax=uncultured Corynebacterium sp. TaxID=159447 RepID=UPI0025E220EA|nr:phage antirepressor KilAC domain-containing protein [uncultured Corynebacterium sp.]
MIPDGDSFKVAAPGLAKSLGFAEARDMLRSIPEAEKGSEIAPTLGGEQRITVVTEAGFYRAIGNRQAARVKDVNIRAQVERFQSWVYGEVLPTIRKTGGYRGPEMSRDELMARAVIFADSRIKELESTNHQQAEQLAAAAPAVEYHDTYVAESDQLSFRTVASTLDMGEKALRNLLIEKGWIYKETSSRRSQKTGEIVPQYRYSEYADKKPYFIRRQNHDAPRFRGEVDHTLKITPAGAAAIKRAVGKWLRADQSELDLGGRNAA